MKKIFTLIAAALMTLGANAQKATYAMQEGETHAAGETVDVKLGDEVVATLTFGFTNGAEFKAAKADNNVEGFTAYTEGNGENGKADSGTNYIIRPKHDGTIEVGVVLNAGKNFFVLEDEVALADYNGMTEEEKVYKTYSFDVKGGKEYKVYCTGSKLGFYGFNYTTGEAGGDEPTTPEVPYILTEDEPGVFAVTMTLEEITATFEAQWVADAWNFGAKVPAGTVMAENDDVKLVAGYGGVPVYVSKSAGGQKISDIQKDFPTYTGYINAGSSLPQNNWTGAEVLLDEASAAKSNHGFVVAYPKKDGVLKCGAYAGDNSRSIGIYRLTTMEEQDAGDLGGLVAYNNFRNDGEEGTVLNAAAYTEGNVVAGKTYLILAGENKNVNMHQISFVAGATTDGIDSVAAETVKNDVMYNIAGQRISAPVSGQIYIMNGKKYIAK